jgi:hypothetical protein
LPKLIFSEEEAEEWKRWAPGVSMATRESENAIHCKNNNNNNNMLNSPPAKRSAL